MRVLVCASEAPLPPLNGMRLQVRALCEHLAKRNEVCVLALRWPGQEGSPPEGVELHTVDGPRPGLVRRTLDRALSVARRDPVDVRRLASPMVEALGPLLATRDFDVAHVTMGALTGVAPALGPLPAVIAPLDAWSLNVATGADAATGIRRAWLRLTIGIVARHEARAYRPFAKVVLVSPEDARETVRLDPTLSTAVITNGVDTDFFRPPAGNKRHRRRLVFTGALSVTANVAAARRLAVETLPRVRRLLPDAELHLVGRAPTPEVKALAGLPGVGVEADVPDLRPWLHGAGVYACPMMSGTGIKNKLLEAMAAEAPCVVTSLASRGLEVTDGEHCLVADDEDALAAAVVRVLEDDALASRLGEAGRHYVLEHHTWDVVARSYEELYREVSERARHDPTAAV